MSHGLRPDNITNSPVEHVLGIIEGGIGANHVKSCPQATGITPQVRLRPLTTLPMNWCLIERPIFDDELFCGTKRICVILRILS